MYMRQSSNSTCLGPLFLAERGGAAAPISTASSAGSPVLISSHRPGFALDLGAVHDAPGSRVEGIAAVHRAAVVPQNEVAQPSVIVPGQVVAGRVRQNLVEQRLGFGERESIDISIAAAAEIKALATRFGVRADERVDRARGLARIVARRHAGPDIAAAVVGSVVFYPQPGDAIF